MIGLTSDVLGPQWHVDVEELLNGEREALLVAHHGHVVQAVKVGQSLKYFKLRKPIITKYTRAI